MKKIILLGGFLLSCLLTIAQTVDYVKTSGGSGNEGMSASVIAKDGGVINVGYFQNTADFDPGGGVSNLTVIGTGTQQDIYIQKLDAAGELVWVKQIGHAGFQIAYDVEVDTTGNIYILGTASSGYGNVDLDPGTGVAEIDPTTGTYFYLKLDADGNYLWGSNSDFVANELQLSRGGDLYATGYYNQVTDFDPGPGVSSATPQNINAAIVKLDTDGNFQWVKTMGGGGVDVGRGLAINSDDTKLWFGLGTTSSTLTEYPVELTGFSMTNAGSEDFLIFGLDLSTDQFDFYHQYGTSGTEQIGKFTTDESDNLLATGRFSGLIDFDHTAGGVDNYTGGANGDAFVLKINSDYSYGWTNHITGASSGLNNRKGDVIACDKLNKVYAGGYFNGSTEMPPIAGTISSNGGADYYIKKMGPTGNELWVRYFGGTGEDRIYEVVVNDLYEVFATGAFESTFDFNQGDTPAINGASQGGYDIFFQKILQCTPSSSNDVVSACGQYTWIDGNTYTSSNNTASHIIPNGAASGCDSVVNLDLTINTPETIIMPTFSTLCLNESPFEMNSISVSIEGGTFISPYISDNKFNTNSAGASIHSFTYEAIDGNGCLASAFGDLQVLPIPSIDVTITNANCGEENGFIEANVTGGTPPYSRYWSNGESTDVITGLEPNNYYYNITDANNCSVMKVATVAAGEIGLTGTVVSNACFGDSDGSIDLNVIGSTGPYTFFWSNGATSEDISGLVAGQYEVFVTNGSGCTSTKSFNVLEPNFFTTDIVKTNPTACVEPDGGFNVTIHGGTAPFDFSWKDVSGTEFSTQPNPSFLIAGQYHLTYTDVNNCTDSIITFLSDFSGPQISVVNAVSSNCVNGGAIDVSIESVEDLASISWSNGEVTEDISGLSSGQYVINATNVLGCMGFKDITIQNEMLEATPICMVSVDTSTNTNLVIWEKPVSSEIDYFVIYRESSVAGEFLVVDSVDYNDDSEFTDPVAYPHLRSWRYKMTTVDMCGTESAFSDIHKTMHITLSPGVGGSFNIYWDDYEGFLYPTVSLYRYYEGLTEFELVSDLPYGTYSYTDTPISSDGIDYIVEISPPATCSSTKANDYNSSRSNRSAGISIGGGSTNIEDHAIIDFQIYPNPFQSEIEIQFNSMDKVELEIVDVEGRNIKSVLVNSGDTVDLENLNKGIYFIRFLIGDSVQVQKMIKN
jgi:hypothetical protein